MAQSISSNQLPWVMQAPEVQTELGIQQLPARPPFLEVRWEMLQHNPSILYFKNVRFTLQVPTQAQSCVACRAS